MAAPMVTCRLMEPAIILHTEPLPTDLMAVAGASAGASAGAEASAEASAEEDDGGKPENPALKAALEHYESKAAASRQACEAQIVFCA